MTPRWVRGVALLLAAAACSAACARHKTCYGLRQEAAGVSTGRLLLRWEPFVPPPEWASDPAASPGEVLKVTYDVVVLDARSGLIACERSGIEDPAYRVEAPLFYSSKYAWTVRPRVATAHGVRLGPWSQTVYDDAIGRTPAVPPPFEAMERIR